MSILRRAHASDLPGLLNIIAPYFSPAFHWDSNQFRAEFDYAQTWVIERDSEVVAFACLRDAIDAWEISVLATRKDQQGQGLMKLLLKSLIEKYGHERHLWLEVHEKNVSAQKLYESMRFQHDGNRGGYYTDGSTALLYSYPKRNAPS